MPDRPSSAQIGDLIRRCMDGVATDVEAAQLDRLVAGDPRVAGELVMAARLESGLELLFRADPGALPAQPPSDIAHARRQRTVWVAAGGIAAAAAVVLALTWSRLPGPAPGKTVTLDSTPRPTSSRSAVEDAKPRRSDFGHRQFFSDGSVADLRDDSSRLEIRVATATAMDVVLTKGAARFEIAPRPDRRFRIWVASAHVEVIGTVFTVERLPSAMRVSVERGTVKVVSGKNEMLLSGGASEVVPIEPSEARTAERLRSRPHPQVPAEEIERPAAIPKDVPGALLLASEEARRRGRPDEALTLLRRFLDIHSNDPRAPYAAFIMGRVLLEELARPREAAAAFARVEALNSGTPLVQDALAREVESWSRAGDSGKARQRAGAYLLRYPNGQRANEVRRYGQMQ